MEAKENDLDAFVQRLRTAMQSIDLLALQILVKREVDTLHRVGKSMRKNARRKNAERERWGWF